MGTSPQFRWTRLGGHAGIRRPKCLLLDRRISSRWSKDRCDARNPRCRRSTYFSGTIRCGTAGCGTAIHRVDRRKRGAGDSCGSACGTGWVGARCHLVRRFPSCVTGCRHRAQRSVLHGLSGCATGVSLGLETRIFVSGAAVPLAGQGQGNGRRSGAG